MRSETSDLKFEISDPTLLTSQRGICKTLFPRPSHANVVVIGSDVANTLFPFSNAVDQQVSINGRSYLVVGVLTAGMSF